MRAVGTPEHLVTGKNIGLTFASVSGAGDMMLPGKRIYVVVIALKKPLYILVTAGVLELVVAT
jgi:hypothetical protein